MAFLAFIHPSSARTMNLMSFNAGKNINALITDIKVAISHNKADIIFIQETHTSDHNSKDFF